MQQVSGRADPSGAQGTEPPALMRKGTEAMRRGLLTLTALGLLGAALGCHTHGICDCNVHPIGYGTMAGYHDNVYGPSESAHGPVVTTNAPAATPPPASDLAGHN